MKNIRVGLIGRGMAGTVFHAPLIRAVARMELVAVAGSADAPAVIADPDVDLIVVATPNRSHFPLARAALSAGKDVVVDKPFTVTLGEADALIALAAEKARLLTVFHNRRWDGDFMTVRELIEAGRLGEVMLFEAHWDRFRPAIKQGWREEPGDGAGLLSDLGPHMIDQALLLFGAPDAIYADIEVQRPEAKVDDYFALMLHYGARRVHLSASTLAAAPRPRFAVHGTGASFIKYGLDRQEQGLSEDDPANYGTLTLQDGTASRIATAPGGYGSFYEAVAEAVLGEGRPPVDPADARAGLRLIELARRSAREGRAISV